MALSHHFMRKYTILILHIMKEDKRCSRIGGKRKNERHQERRNKRIPTVERRPVENKCALDYNRIVVKSKARRMCVINLVIVSANMLLIKNGVYLFDKYANHIQNFFFFCVRLFHVLKSMP